MRRKQRTLNELQKCMQADAVAYQNMCDKYQHECETLKLFKQMHNEYQNHLAQLIAEIKEID